MLKEVNINTSKLNLTQGDITKESTDAIVNAANTHLAGGGGVDCAIHLVGGLIIRQDCIKIGVCHTGRAVITTYGKLKAHYIIHAVGPSQYYDYTKGETALLKSAYLKSLKLTSARNLKSIAFPVISTRAYGYPVNDTARIALKTSIEYLKQHTDIELVRFVLFDRITYEISTEQLKNLL